MPVREFPHPHACPDCYENRYRNPRTDIHRAIQIRLRAGCHVPTQHECQVSRETANADASAIQRVVNFVCAALGNGAGLAMLGANLLP